MMLYSQNYFAGTQGYLQEELSTRILMDSTEMQKMRIQVGQSSMPLECFVSLTARAGRGVAILRYRHFKEFSY
jgi:hypothetical protein